MKYKLHEFTKGLLFTFLAGSIFACSVSQNNSAIVKSANDQYEYDTFTLKNGLEVMLASDPKMSDSAATLSVGVGSYQNPKSQQGLAHFLEHMVLQSSKKYPEVNAYKDFVMTNGGKVNGMTSSTLTVYPFSINSEHFEQALDMLSSNIKEPLLNRTSVEKELSAVHAEWHGRHQSDNYLYRRVLANVANPKHPIRKFSTGNKETLRDKPNSNLYESLVNFHKQYYSANLMKLALVGPQSLEELKQLASAYFSDIKNTNVDVPEVAVSAFTETQKHIFVKSNKKNQYLSLMFPMEDNSSEWKHKPNKLISYLLNYDEKGTLVSQLREQQLVENMSARVSSSSLGKGGMISASFELTEKGKQNIDVIISSFFAYVDLIKSQGIDSSLVSEFKTLYQQSFEDYKSPPTYQLATQLSMALHKINAQDILRYNSYFEGVNQAALNEVLSTISPTNMLVVQASETEKTNRELHFAKGSYRVENISESSLSKWSATSSQLALSLPVAKSTNSNKANITESLPVKPEVILQQPGVRLVAAKSERFPDKEGVIVARIVNNQEDLTAKEFVELGVIYNLLRKENKSLSQSARRKHRSNISFRVNNFGIAYLQVAGRTNQHIALIKEVVDSLVNLKFDVNDVEIEKEKYLDYLQNIKVNKLVEQLKHNQALAIGRPPAQFADEDRISALKAITVESLEQALSKHLKNNFFDLFMYGNYDLTQSKQFALTVRKTLGDKNILDNWHYSPKFAVQPGAIQTVNVETEKAGVGIVDTYIYPERSSKVSIQLKMLNNLVNTRFFSELRTQQEIGYSVGTTIETIHKRPSLTMMVISDDTDLNTIKLRINEFKHNFKDELALVPENKIEQFKKAFIASINQEPKNIFAELRPYVKSWSLNKLTFDSKEKSIESIQNTTKQDLVDLYNSLMIKGNSHNVIVQVKGEDFSGSPFFKFEAEE